jgi:hypothetical protein
MSAAAALRREAPVARPVRRDAEIVALPSADAESWRHPGDMHLGVYGSAVACWAVFLALFWITFSGSGNALFILTICLFYAVVFFSVPAILTRLIPEKRPSRGSLLSFMRGTIQTIDGPVKGYDALIQVILVPACLSIGGLAIGIIIAMARASH